MRPLVVVEGSPGAAADLVATAVAAARSSGWTIVRGWAAPLRRERVVCTGRIDSADDARRALLAVVTGAGLVVGAAVDRETLDQFLDDLRRLGPIRHLTAPAGTRAR